MPGDPSAALGMTGNGEQQAPKGRNKSAQGKTLRGCVKNEITKNKKNEITSRHFFIIK
jgi:hypothetical protein